MSNKEYEYKTQVKIFKYLENKKKENKQNTTISQPIIFIYVVACLDYRVGSCLRTKFLMVTNRVFYLYSNNPFLGVGESLT